MGDLRERCGIICDDNFYEIKNISDNDYEFVCDPIYLYNVLKEHCNYQIKYIVHTHSGNCLPSIKDIESMKIWKIPWIIVGSKCIKAFVYSDGSITEINVNAFLSQKLYNLIMKLLH